LKFKKNFSGIKRKQAVGVRRAGVWCGRGEVDGEEKGEVEERWRPLTYTERRLAY